MQQRLEHNDRATIRESVRRNAGSTGIAAALLIYFGFFRDLIEPTGTSLFDWGNWLFLYTLRIGGVAMTVITAWSMLGQPVVLLVDAIVSMLIGVAFVLSGVAMLLDHGGTQAFLNVIFGVLFVSAGVRNGREWAGYAAVRIANGNCEIDAPSKGDRHSHPDKPLPPPTSLAGQLRERTAQTGSTGEHARPPRSSVIAPARNEPAPPTKAPEPTPATKSDEAISPQEDVKTNVAGGSQSDPEPPTPDPPDGFLASFADDDSPGRI